MVASRHIVTLTLLLTATAACGERGEEDPLAGSYEMSRGTVEMSNGQYTYRSEAGDTVLARGQYEIRNDTVVFVDQGGELACVGQPGVYALATEGGEPLLTMVADPCEGRVEDIRGSELGGRTSQS